MATNSKATISLGDVQQTLLIPLYGRALETRKRKPLLVDERAELMVRSIDYDFSRFDGATSLFGSVLRTAMFDEWVKLFLNEEPRSTVVELGCGLNTRFERLDNGAAHFFELDLPDVIELRRRFFDDVLGPPGSSIARRTMRSGSLLDPSWVAAVKERPAPYLFSIEAVLVYLREHEVRYVLETIATHFPGARVAFDTASKAIVDDRCGDDALKDMAARFRWACDNPKTLESWAPLRLKESRTFAQPQPTLRSRLPFLLRSLGLLVFRQRVNGYRLNLFEARTTT